MISQKTIDKIFSTIRVEEIIGEYVQLKRAGSNFKGLSPFHDEKTPSFVVSPSKQIWKDFSSGKGGSAITFLMEIENFTYPEALRHAAKKYGIEIEEDKVEYSEEQKKAQTERELLYKIHEVANTFFQEILWDNEEGKAIGLSYFKERELHDDIIKKFQLGYSPEQKDAFTKYALEKGYEKEILEKSGISIFPENTPTGVDRFRERVIFPIHSFSGRVLGFGARILKSNVKTAKYLNSPETEIYHKSNVLYGLNQSKQAISKENLCLLVEGYMDVISLHQSGIENVVASSGTALTTEQIKLIKRLTENVTILFDGDAAGIKASFRSIDMLLSEGMNIRVVLFPDGDDPDSFARKNPRDFVEDFIKNQAKDFIHFKTELVLQDILKEPLKKSQYAKEILKTISLINDPLKEDGYIKDVANILSYYFDFDSLYREFGFQKQITSNQKLNEKQKKETPYNKNKVENDKLELVSDAEFISKNPLLVLEEKLVELMLKFGQFKLFRKTPDNENYETTVIEEIINHLEEDQYQPISPLNQRIIEEIKLGIQQNELRSSDFFKTFMDEEVVTKTADALINAHETSNWEKHNIYFSKEEELVDKIVKDVIIRHKREFVVKIINDLKHQISEENSAETYLKIMNLTKLKNKIDENLFRIL